MKKLIKKQPHTILKNMTIEELECLNRLLSKHLNQMTTSGEHCTRPFVEKLISKVNSHKSKP